MATTPHVIQYLAVFLGALWWSKHTLMNRGGGVRWRQFLSALVGAVLWIPVAYMSTAVADSASGVVITFGAPALGYIGVIMVFVMFITAILSIVLWSMEEAEDSASELMDDLPGPTQRGP